MKNSPDFLKFFRKKSKKGSILLEIAVGISVLSVISGFVIRKTLAANRYMKEQQTKENIDTTVIAIASFVANNHRLPRPAETANGIESASPNRCFGYIPYKTLGLAEARSRDGNMQPLVYMVEPNLTQNFYRIYADEFDDNVFCREIIQPKISAEGFRNKDVIAFAIDTKNHKNTIGEKITIHPTAHTFWISRDVLLIKYLKDAPCAAEKFKQKSSSHLQDFEDDF